MDDNEKILHLIRDLKIVASKFGTMHAFWDTAFEMESFLKGEKTLLNYSASEWIEYAERLLKNQSALYHKK